MDMQPTFDENDQALETIAQALFTDYDLEWQPDGHAHAGWRLLDFRHTGAFETRSIDIDGQTHEIQVPSMAARGLATGDTLPELVEDAKDNGQLRQQ